MKIDDERAKEIAVRLSRAVNGVDDVRDLLADREEMRAELAAARDALRAADVAAPAIADGIERLAMMLDSERGLAIQASEHATKARADLEASQAREATLRGVLMAIVRSDESDLGTFARMCERRAREALALPSNRTALDAAIAQAVAAEREACALLLDEAARVQMQRSLGAINNTRPDLCAALARAIRVRAGKDAP